METYGKPCFDRGTCIYIIYIYIVYIYNIIYIIYILYYIYIYIYYIILYIILYIYIYIHYPKIAQKVLGESWFLVLGSKEVLGPLSSSSFQTMP